MCVLLPMTKMYMPALKLVDGLLCSGIYMPALDRSLRPPDPHASATSSRRHQRVQLRIHKLPCVVHARRHNFDRGPELLARTFEVRDILLHHRYFAVDGLRALVDPSLQAHNLLSNAIDP